MSKNAVENATEIKLGCVAYLVEREFIGTSSREELLISRLLERYIERTSGRKIDPNRSRIGKVDKLHLCAYDYEKYIFII